MSLTFYSALRKLNTQTTIHVDASYQVSVHLARKFQRRRFFIYRPIRNKNCLWWPCLLTDRDEMSDLHRGQSIDASCHVSVNLAKRFQRKRFLKIGQWIRNKNCMWRAMFGTGSLERTFHRCFQLSFSSFGRWVSEEKIKMWKVHRW